MRIFFQTRDRIIPDLTAYILEPIPLPPVDLMVVLEVGSAALNLYVHCTVAKQSMHTVGMYFNYSNIKAISASEHEVENPCHPLLKAEEELRNF